VFHRLRRMTEKWVTHGFLPLASDIEAHKAVAELTCQISYHTSHKIETAQYHTSLPRQPAVHHFGTRLYLTHRGLSCAACPDRVVLTHPRQVQLPPPIAGEQSAVPIPNIPYCTVSTLLARSDAQTGRLQSLCSRAEFLVTFARIPL